MAQRLGHFVARRRRGGILEGGEAAVDLGRGEMKAARQTGGLKTRRDLFHLGDPAPGFSHFAGDRVGFPQRLRLRQLPFLDEARVDAFGLRQRADGGDERRRALGPGRVGHLQCRGGAGLALERDRLHMGRGEQRGDFSARSAAQLEPGPARCAGRRADDAAVDEGGARGLDRSADLARGRGRDRIGVDVNAAEVFFGDRPGQIERAVRRADGKHDLGRRERAVEGFAFLEPRRLRALPGGGAAALRYPQHVKTAGNEARAQRGAHLAGMQQGDGLVGHRETPRTLSKCILSNTTVNRLASAASHHTRRMSEVIQAKMGPIPPPRGTPTMQLVDIIGKQGVGEITAAGKIRFHSVGDTGRPGGADAAQEAVTNAMTSNYNPSTPGDNPAFFLHLGDVIYGHDKEQLYRDEFYRPYMKYPGKILAIGGNHDGESDPPHPKPLSASLANFCATSAVVPPAADNVRIFRQTMTQPGVYWLLQAPFVNMIGLYSNIAEGPGDLLGTNRDDKQIQWLKKTLAYLKKAKDGGDKAALVIATHHPPFSEGGHGGSPAMLTQIDDACTGAGIIPHAMLAGHSHNYQRYTRTVRFGAVTGKLLMWSPAAEGTPR